MCGSDHFCAFHAEGWVKCKKRGPGATSETPGWIYIRPIKDGRMGEAWKWTPPGFVPDEAPKRNDLTEREIEERKRQLRIKTARSTWSKSDDPGKDCGANHHRLRAYFEARGIRPDLLPDGLIPSCLRYNPECEDTYRKETRTWTKAPAMVALVVQADGTSSGIHRTFLDPAGEPKKRPGGHGEARKKLGTCSGGAVRLSENYKSGVLLVGEGIETVGSALAACWSRVAAWAALDAVSLENLVLPDGLVAYGVTDAIHTVIIVADLDANGVGQAAAFNLAAKLSARHPWLTIEIALPTPDLYPELVTTGQDKRPFPANGGGVDWNDIIVRYGPELTGRGVIGRADFETNRKRAFEWRPGSEAASTSTRPPGAGTAPSPPANQSKSRERVVIEGSPLLRARRFLLDQESPPRGQRGGRGFYIRRWNETWWEYDLSRWNELKTEHLRGRVWHWLQGCCKLDEKGKVCRVNPSKDDVDQLLAALTTDTAVAADKMPCWLPPSFSAEGEPRWGIAAPGRRHEQSLPKAGQIIAYENVLLDADKWADGRLDLIRHHPLWFSASVLPFSLPYNEIAAAVNAGAEAELLERLCPTWLRFLRDVSLGSAKWIECLQEFFGYSLVHSTALEKILVIIGPTRSGKGTIERAWAAVLGIQNIVYTSFDRLTERFHMAAFVGKNLAVMSDAHVGKWTDTTGSLEKLKAISGGDATLIEWKHARDMPMLRLPARFVIYCNEMPSLMDSSNALAGRLIVLPMLKSYLGKEDLTLKDRIVAEAQGIMVWALFGLRQLWQRMAAGQGFTIPDESRRAVEEFARESSPAYSFAEDCLTLDESSIERVAVVYAAWRAWCEIYGRQPGSIESFSRKLKSAYPQIKTKQRVITEDLKRAKVRVYIGLKLSSPPTGYARPGLVGPDPGPNAVDDDDVPVSGPIPI